MRYQKLWFEVCRNEEHRLGGSDQGPYWDAWRAFVNAVLNDGYQVLGNYTARTAVVFKTKDGREVKHSSGIKPDEIIETYSWDEPL